jgi:small subunit ribosomal protein S21
LFLKGRKSISNSIEVLFLLENTLVKRPFGAFYETIKLKRGYLDMKVIVRDNQIEKAIRDLKRKLTKEGFFSEIKERRFYDKPSVQKKKKQAKAAKRRRKRVRRF